MTRCDHCGNEVVLPFSCQYCGGKYCPDCRLPPNHNCVNIALWNSKPRPAVGISYGKGGGATPTGDGYIADSRCDAKKKRGDGIPYLKIMIAIIVLILLGIAYLVFSGYHTG
ncbi:MAG: AN1-type zinc finger protein [Methanoregula sp.]|nr:AN1-type zinc finger protein [Methanoregula sp.]